MEEKNNNNEKNNKWLYIGIAIGLVVLIGLAVGIYFYTTNSDEVNEKEIAYTELIKQINDGNVEKIEMTVGSTTVKVKLKDVEEEKKGIIPSTQAFIELVQQKVEEGNNIELIQNPTNVFVTISSTLFLQ